MTEQWTNQSELEQLAEREVTATPERIQLLRDELEKMSYHKDDFTKFPRYIRKTDSNKKKLREVFEFYDPNERWNPKDNIRSSFRCQYLSFDSDEDFVKYRILTAKRDQISGRDTDRIDLFFGIPGLLGASGAAGALTYVVAQSGDPLLAAASGIAIAMAGGIGLAIGGGIGVLTYALGGNNLINWNYQRKIDALCQDGIIHGKDAINVALYDTGFDMNATINQKKPKKMLDKWLDKHFPTW